MSTVYKGGYVRDKDAVARYVKSTPLPFFGQCDGEIRNTGSKARVRLMAGWEKITGSEFVPHKQIHGTCVGESGALGADFTCIGDILAGDREEWKGTHSVEVAYALSRVEVGGGKLRGNDGSNGSWMAEALTKYGALLRGVYGDYDLTEARHDLAKKWGDQGCPDDLEKLAEEHPVKSAKLCTAASESADGVANGYPTLVCSNRGFRMTADREGFLLPSGIWYHAMLIVGVDSESERRGFEIANSWGVNWVQGPKHKLGVAPGCFWADWDVVNKMLAQGDSYVLSGFEGYKARLLSHVWF